MNRRRSVIVALAMAAVGSLALAGCIDGGCSPYTNSVVWIGGGTSEQLYYALSKTPQLTPECWVKKLPVEVACIVDFKPFSPRQVMANPSYTLNWEGGYGRFEGYNYLLLLRYNDSVVACYDVSRQALARADYPWFKGVADSTRMERVEWEECHDAEVTYNYIFYITDDML